MDPKRVRALSPVAGYQPGRTIPSRARAADATAKGRGVVHRVDILAHERGLEYAIGDIDRVAGQLPLAPAARTAEAQFLGSEGLDGEQGCAQYRQVHLDFSAK